MSWQQTHETMKGIRPQDPWRPEKTEAFNAEVRRREELRDPKLRAAREAVERAEADAHAADRRRAEDSLPGGGHAAAA